MTTVPGSATGVPAAPAATRARRPGWRDPRIVAGVLIVALSVLGGARLLATADDTVAVWAVTRDLPVGATVGADALERRRVRFADAADADRYLGADQRLPSGATLVRAVGAGELLPRAALGHDDASRLVEVPLSVAPDDLPATVHRGAVVDVWSVPDASGSGSRGPTRLVLGDVLVLDVPTLGDSLAPEATRQVIIGVPRSLDLGPAIGQLASGHLVLTRKG